MKPDFVIEDDTNRKRLQPALLRFAAANPVAATRQAILKNARAELPLLRLDDSPAAFAANLTYQFLDMPISEKDGVGHPLLFFTDWVLETGARQYGFSDEDDELFRRIRADGKDRSSAVRARRSIGKVENDDGEGIGTCTLVSADLVLTCQHVLSKSGVQQAWARFGYKTNWDGTVAAGARFELDLATPVCEGGGRRPDFVLLRLLQAPPRPVEKPVNIPLNQGQAIRTIHHPEGRPAVVSAPAKIHQAGADYLYHDLVTENGSSGAPIFDRTWKFVALHRGHLAAAPAGTTAGVPLYAFWQDIAAHVAP